MEEKAQALQWQNKTKMLLLNSELDIVVQWIAFLLSVLEVFESILGLKASYYD
jgi:hypothetical protein